MKFLKKRTGCNLLACRSNPQIPMRGVCNINKLKKKNNNKYFFFTFNLFYINIFLFKSTYILTNLKLGTYQLKYKTVICYCKLIY